MTKGIRHRTLYPTKAQLKQFWLIVTGVEHDYPSLGSQHAINFLKFIQTFIIISFLLVLLAVIILLLGGSRIGLEVQYTLFFINPQKNSNAFKSGHLACQPVRPILLIQELGSISSKTKRMWRFMSGEAPSCWKTALCGSCSACDWT